MEIPLVVLCSRQPVEQVAERVGRVNGPGPRRRYRRWLPPAAARSVDLPPRLRTLERWPRQRPEPQAEFGLRWPGRGAGGRSLRRRRHHVVERRIARHAASARQPPIAGMVCRKFPDNSVFCHARRLAKLPQDVFVTGAVLGVNCTDLPLPFFPDIYNEDWFFFAEAAARHRLPRSGEARQAEYDPFDDPARAHHEEFGDLLAEGLYSLIEDREPLDRAGPDSWLSDRSTTRPAELVDLHHARRPNSTSTHVLAGATTATTGPSEVYAAIAALTAADPRYRRSAQRDHPDPVRGVPRCVGRTRTCGQGYSRTGNVRPGDDAMKPSRSRIGSRYVDVAAAVIFVSRMRHSTCDRAGVDRLPSPPPLEPRPLVHVPSDRVVLQHPQPQLGQVRPVGRSRRCCPGCCSEDPPRLRWRRRDPD